MEKLNKMYGLALIKSFHFSNTFAKETFIPISIFIKCYLTNQKGEMIIQCQILHFTLI